MPSVVFLVMGRQNTTSARGLMKLVLPPRPARSMPSVYRLPWLGKIGLSIVLWTKLGVTWLISRLPPSLMSSASARNGLRPMTSGSRKASLMSFTRDSSSR